MIVILRQLVRVDPNWNRDLYRKNCSCGF